MEKIEVYKTKDGKIHETIDAAKSHMADSLCEVMDGYLSGMLKCDPQQPLTRNHMWKRSHIVDVVEFLTGDYDKAKALISDLNKALETIDTDI